jgi:VanZ family protein
MKHGPKSPNTAPGWQPTMLMPDRRERRSDRREEFQPTRPRDDSPYSPPPRVPRSRATINWATLLVYALSIVVTCIIIALLLPSKAHAGSFACTHEPCPADNWGGAQAHVAISAGIGALTYTLAPSAPWYAQTALCLMPGLAREYMQRSQPGNRFSAKDMAANLAGCGIGLGVAHGVSLSIDPVRRWAGVRVEVPL